MKTNAKLAKNAPPHLDTIVPVESIEIAAWSPGDVDKGDATTQVHMFLNVSELDATFVVRLKSRSAANVLLAELAKQRDQVWPQRSVRSTRTA